MYITKKFQLEYIQQLNIPSDSVVRMDCPFCLHKNTFSVNTEDGKISWKCFHASCTIGGTTERPMTKEDVEKFLELSSNNRGAEPKPIDWTIPKHFTNIQSSEKCFNYVKENNCYPAYLEGKVTIYYDPRKDRTAFIVKKDNEPVSAVGRSLNPLTNPKWFNYNKTNVPFTCGTSDVAVVVEDCASACAVSSVHTGVALLGTTLKEEYSLYLSENFKKVIIALDRDATQKAFDLSKGLRYLIDTEVKVLEEDLKYLDVQKIKELFNVA
jgi:hypothetical protein